MFKVTIRTPERSHWHWFGVFIVNFGHISHVFPMFLLLNLNLQMPTGRLYTQASNNVNFNDVLISKNIRCEKEIGKSVLHQNKNEKGSTLT